MNRIWQKNQKIYFLNEWLERLEYIYNHPIDWIGCNIKQMNRVD